MIKPDRLVNTVCESRAFNYPLTTNKAKDLASAAGYDVRQCLTLGLEHLVFRWFPHAKVWATTPAHKQRYTWDQRSLLEVWVNDRPLSKEGLVAQTSMRVIEELER